MMRYIPETADESDLTLGAASRKLGVPRRTRRQVLGAGSSLVTVSLVGCDTSTTPADQNDRGRAESLKAREAPRLATLVESGDLPPLDERLPDEPMIVEPAEQLGVYGGTWNTALLGPADTVWLRRTINYEGLMRWDPEWTEAIPNVAASVDASEDGREFTITLRRGMKWSDGTPFTVDDIIFAHEDVLLNEELTPVLPTWFVTDDEPATLEQIDDQTVRVTFSQPAGLFIDELARPQSGGWFVDKPRHYLEQFHPTYNPDVDQLADEEGFSTWAELFTARMDAWSNKDIPRLDPWILTSEPGEGTRLVAERNPYYWKTDPDGRQLPYIDEVVFDVVSEAQVILLMASNGELDFHSRHINSLANKPVLARSREAEDFHFITLESSLMNEMVIFLNLTYEDPVKREVFQNKDFRIGLSHAINRPELNNAIFQRQGQPWQAAPARQSEFFDEEFATQYLDYDPSRANEHLDRAGYRDRDDDGYRLGPNGERISLTVEVATGFVDFWVDAMDLVVDYWDEVGIEARVKSEDRSLLVERTVANQHEAAVWTGGGGVGDEIFRPFFYLPMRDRLVTFATLWARWYASRGSDGEEPPPAVVRQMELYWQLQSTPDEEGRNELFHELLSIAKEQFYVIGTIRVPEGYGIVHNDFHNVPATMPESADYNTPAPTNPAQYFIE